jgi:hypothetical protein
LKVPAPCDAGNQKVITITMEGGIIHGVEGIPNGITVRVHDFDIEGAEPESITTTANGDKVCVSEWQSEGQRERRRYREMLDLPLVQRQRTLPDAALHGWIDKLRLSRLVPARGGGRLAQLQAHALRPDGSRRPGMRKHARLPNPGGGSHPCSHARPADGCAIR